VPRNEAVRARCKPVYTKHPGWTEDICGVRRFADLPVNAQRYTAAMVRSLIAVAYAGGLPADIGCRISATSASVRYPRRSSRTCPPPRS
jgi:hypothetical protein